MKLFIPHLGTPLTLVRPWTFRLHHEMRNETLGDKLGLHVSYKERYKPLPALAKQHGFKSVDDLWQHDRALYHRLSESLPDVKNGWLNGTRERGAREFDMVTLPAGSILTVDRIYIRKLGKKKRYLPAAPGTPRWEREQEEFDATVEYSSVTFRVKLPGQKTGARFWAKLDEVNQIECEVGEYDAEWLLSYRRWTLHEPCTVTEGCKRGVEHEGECSTNA